MFVLAGAVVPAVVLIVYILLRDKYEREPIKKILLTFFVGMLSIPLDLLTIYIFGLNNLPQMFDNVVLQQIATAFFWISVWIH